MVSTETHISLQCTPPAEFLLGAGAVRLAGAKPRSHRRSAAQRGLRARRRGRLGNASARERLPLEVLAFRVLDNR